MCHRFAKLPPARSSLRLLLRLWLFVPSITLSSFHLPGGLGEGGEEEGGRAHPLRLTGSRHGAQGDARLQELLIWLMGRSSPSTPRRRHGNAPRSSPGASWSCIIHTWARRSLSKHTSDVSRFKKPMKTTTVMSPCCSLCLSLRLSVCLSRCRARLCASQADASGCWTAQAAGDTDFNKRDYRCEDCREKQHLRACFFGGGGAFVLLHGKRRENSEENTGIRGFFCALLI